MLRENADLIRSYDCNHKKRVFIGDTKSVMRALGSRGRRDIPTHIWSLYYHNAIAIPL